MASLLQLFSLFFPCLLIYTASSNQIPKHYIVYMGSSSEVNDEAAESDHLQLLSTVIPRQDSGRISLIHHYNHALRGFSAMLTENEASELAGHDGVVSLFPDSVLQLHTTRSWDFLEGQSRPRFSHGSYQHKSSYDVIIGMIDGGTLP
ncbi:hypothetical protein SCA6_002126 [Theobroma cacao]